MLKQKPDSNKIFTALPFLKDIDKGGMSDIDRFGIYSVIPRNEILTREGESCSYFSFILSGTIKVFKVAESGREITLYRLGVGESCILTASCILSKKNFPALSISETEVEIISIPSNLFVEWIDRYSVWRNYIFNLISVRLDSIISIVEEIAFRNVDVRLAQYLLKYSDNIKQEIKSTHQNIAADIGTSREVISRLLKDLEQEEIVSLARGSIRVLNHTYLQNKLKKF